MILNLRKIKIFVKKVEEAHSSKPLFFGLNEIFQIPFKTENMAKNFTKTVSIKLSSLIQAFNFKY